MPAPKVFISFNEADEQIAHQLYDALSQAGANVFQFKRSSRPGEVAWKKVHASIEQADWFVVLLSKASVESTSVIDEIEHAYYSRVNNKKPTLIPAMLEEVQKPSELARFANLEFSDFDKGLKDLCETIGLSWESVAPAPVPSQHEEGSVQAKAGRWFGKIMSAAVIVGILVGVAYAFWLWNETDTAEVTPPTIGTGTGNTAAPAYRISLTTIKIVEDGDENNFAKYFWELKLNDQLVAKKVRASASAKEPGEKYELPEASLLVQHGDSVKLTGYVADRDFEKGSFKAIFNPDSYACFDEVLPIPVVKDVFTNSVSASEIRAENCDNGETETRPKIDIVYTVELESVD